MTLLVILAGSARGQGWEPLLGAPTAARIEDVFFLDERMGWTATSGKVYRTLDGGANWEAYDAPGVSMRSIGFATPSHGWIGSLVVDTPVWATVDSGKTWQTVELPEPRPRGICGLWPVDDQVVYGCGRYNGWPVVIKTMNRGSTWSTMDLSAYASTLVDCRFFGPDSGFVVGAYNFVPRILFTPDGGKTWQIRHTGARYDTWCWKISFPSRRVGYVSVQMGGGPGLHCLKTLDGGVTWSEVPVPVRLSDMQGIGFVTETLGWAAGRGPMRSTDGGVTWEDDPIGIRINRIRFLTSGLGYASGATIYKYDGKTSIEPSTLSKIKTKFR